MGVSFFCSLLWMSFVQWTELPLEMRDEVAARLDILGKLCLSWTSREHCQRFRQQLSRPAAHVALEHAWVVYDAPRLVADFLPYAVRDWIARSCLHALCAGRANTFLAFYGAEVRFLSLFADGELDETDATLMQGVPRMYVPRASVLLALARCTCYHEKTLTILLNMSRDLFAIFHPQNSTGHYSSCRLCESRRLARLQVERSHDLIIAGDPRSCYGDRSSAIRGTKRRRSRACRVLVCHASVRVQSLVSPRAHTSVRLS